MPSPTNRTPAAMGYAMPAEWERHEASWLGWSHEDTDFPGQLDAIRQIYGEMARRISTDELVRILVRDTAEQTLVSDCLKQAGCNLERVRFVTHPTNRGWTRDTGPIFVRRKAEEGKRSEETAIVLFHFKTQDEHPDGRRETPVPETAAKLLNRPLFDALCDGRDFLVEGGGIDANGCGSLLAAEECHLNPKIRVRNSGMAKVDYEQMFSGCLGVRNILWLRNGCGGGENHCRIDGIARFVNPSTLVLVREPDRRESNWQALAENWERVRDLRLENGNRPEVVPLPMPAPLYFGRWRLPATYTHFYICNSCVIVPTFNDPNDQIALGTLAELFPGRPVVGIHALDLVIRFGSLHGLTRQEPSVGQDS